MKKRILIGIILVSILISAYVSIERMRVEHSGQNVEVVLDLESFKELQATIKEPPAQLLQKFKDAGVTSVAIYEKTLKDYAKENKLVLFQGQDLIRQYYLSGGVNENLFDRLYQGQADLDNIYLLFQEQSFYQKIRAQIEALPGDFVKGTYEDVTHQVYILEVENGELKIEGLPLGFSDDEVQLLTDYGFNIVPRVEGAKERMIGLQGTLQSLKERATVSQVIFAGTEVIGYPDKLRSTANILNELNLQVGMIEPFIAYQDGVKELAPMINMNIVRVHSIKMEEMQKYTYEKVLDRYIRAIKERNVRTVYFKPFLAGSGKMTPMMVNKKFLTDLRADLEKDGYQFAIAKPFTNWRTSLPFLLGISLGVLAAGLLLLERFIRLPDWLAYVLLILGIGGIAAISYKGHVLLTRDLMALLAAIVLPSLAIIVGYETAEKGTEKGDRTGIQALYIFVKVTAITLVGVLFVISLLSDVRYIYQVNQFRGIKFTFILPLVIVLAYYLIRLFHAEGLRGYVKVLRKGVTLFNQPVRYSHVLLVALVGVAGLIYIGRTGNQPIIAAPGWEMKLREFLEDIFIFRPRFKEFAIGHPFMLLAFYYMLKGGRKLVLPFLVLGSIGQLTIINTFSHIHTPLIASMIRVFFAIILGVLIGYILIMVYRWFAERFLQYWRQNYE